ncbi:hypothetical protein AB0H03_06600 [Streptomyces sparsogenes]
MIYLAAYVALVILTAGLPLGAWARPRRPGRRADRQLLRLIRHERRTAR